MRDADPSTDRTSPATPEPASQSGNTGPVDDGSAEVFPAEATPADSPPAETGDAAALSNVIDDTAGREEAVEWTTNRLLAGATFEAVTADLVAQGWPEPSAVSVVEEAREATRAQRGVRTRDDVVVGVYRKFGRTMRRVRWLIIIGIILVVITVFLVLNRMG